MRPRRVLVTAAVAATALATTLVTTLTMTAGAASGARSKPLPAPPPVRYVALGDSYSAGTGAGPYTRAGRGCERSASAYPRLWASQHAPASFTSVACAGATAATVLDHQLSALSARTTLVSLTIGGNDVGFSHVMETCVLAWDSACADAVTTAEKSIATTLPGQLDSVLRAIRAHAPRARIVLLGYPDLYDLSRSAGCLGIGTTKRTALNQGADALDRALSAAAARHGDTFADVRADFAGHQICDGRTGYLNAITFPLDNSYHPTAAGQRYGYLPALTAAQP
ncbi:MAG TPA: SGNH/GDSL hydrolase family protein [Streptosporangiaceae bacterium]|nr:SGNH/GDSL hydrolase family protein [Streptosporangiaceae bacterium]